MAKAKSQPAPVKPSQAPKASKGKKPAKKADNGGMSAYFKSIVAEGKKVTWSTPPQIWANSIIVLVMVLLFGAGLWAVDNTFRGVIHVLTVDLPRILS